MRCEWKCRAIESLKQPSPLQRSRGNMLSKLMDSFTFERNVTPLSSPWWIVCAWIVYAAVVFATKKAASAQPGTSGFSGHSWLARLSAGHNFSLTLLSLAMCVGITMEIARYARAEGMQFVFCTYRTAQTPSRILFWMYIFYVSKYYELLDTVILASRGKPLSLLHLWHHTSVILETWLWVDETWIHASLGAWFNSLVHVFMYSYFCASILRIKVPWRKNITQLQIVQFISSFVLTVPHVVLQVKSGWQCAGTRALIASFFFNLSYFILFIQFYRRSYSQKEKYAPKEQ